MTAGMKREAEHDRLLPASSMQGCSRAPWPHLPSPRSTVMRRKGRVHKFTQDSADAMRGFVLSLGMYLPYSMISHIRCRSAEPFLPSIVATCKPQYFVLYADHQRQTSCCYLQTFKLLVSWRDAFVEFLCR